MDPQLEEQQIRLVSVPPDKRKKPHDAGNRILEYARRSGPFQTSDRIRKSVPCSSDLDWGSKFKLEGKKGGGDSKYVMCLRIALVTIHAKFLRG